MPDGRPSAVQQRSIRGQVPNDVEQMILSLQKAAGVTVQQLGAQAAQLSRLASTAAAQAITIDTQVKRINDLERRVAALGG